MPDGAKFDGVVSLREALLKNGDLVTMTLTEKLLTYALGRGLEVYARQPSARSLGMPVTIIVSRRSSLVS